MAGNVLDVCWSGACNIFDSLVLAIASNSREKEAMILPILVLHSFASSRVSIHVVNSYHLYIVHSDSFRLADHSREYLFFLARPWKVL